MPNENVFNFGLVRIARFRTYFHHANNSLASVLRCSFVCHLYQNVILHLLELTSDSYITSIWGFKLSLLFSFLRIAAEKKYKLAIIGIMAACTAFNFSFLMVQINLCSPVSHLPRPTL